MDKLTSQTQTAFIKGRHISDSILIASEVYHLIDRRMSNRLILKLDFEKAFDSIKWSFVDEVLQNMGFGDKWISWIHSIFMNSRIGVLHNGSPTEEFAPTRGLRQGDPLSTLIFNLVGEVLSRLLVKAEELGIFRGVQLPNNGGTISHLQFADDTILFFNNDSNSILGARRVLKCFELISGLKINYEKSSLFGPKMCDFSVSRWASMLGCGVGRPPFKYLGAVIGYPPSRISFWDPLVARIRRQLQE